MSKALDYAKQCFDFVKGLMMISLFSLLFLIFCDHFQELDDLYETLLLDLKSVNLEHFKLQGLGAEVDGTFSQQQVASALQTEEVDDPATQNVVQAVVRKLEPDEVDRLMYVGTLEASCEFSKPSAKAKRYAEIDRQLNKKHLVEFKPDPDQVTKAAEDADNGLPISCYQMTLTIEGFHVKTTLVKTLAKMFKSNSNNPRLAMK